MIEKLFTQIDFLSPPSTLLVKGNKLLKSSIGGIFTILIGLAFLIMFLVYFLRVLDKQDPNVVFSINYSKVANFTLMTDMCLAIGLLSERGVSISNPETYYSITMHYVKTTPSISNDQVNVTFENIELNLTKCTNETFGDKFSIFESTRYADLYCIDPNNNTNLDSLIIQGPVNDPGTASAGIKVSFSTCVNGTSVVCKTSDEISSTLNSYSLNILHSDYLVDQSKPDPLTPFAQKLIYQGPYTLSSSVDVYFKNIYYTDDQGIIFQSDNLTTVPTYDSKDVSLSLDETMRDGSVQFAQVSFGYNTGGYQDYYQRSYKKLTDVLVSVGGFIKVVQIFFQTIINLTYHIGFYDYLLSSNFKIEKQNKSKFTSSVLNSQNLPGPNLLNKSEFKHSNLKNNTLENHSNIHLNEKPVGGMSSNLFPGSISNNVKIIAKSKFKSQDKEGKEIFDMKIIPQLQAAEYKFIDLINIFGCRRRSRFSNKYYYILQLCQEQLEIKNIVRVQNELEILKPLVLKDVNELEVFNTLAKYNHYFMNNCETSDHSEAHDIASKAKQLYHIIYN